MVEMTDNTWEQAITVLNDMRTVINHIRGNTISDDQKILIEKSTMKLNNLLHNHVVVQ